MNKTSHSELEARASAKRVRISSHKMRKVVEQIRGCSCLNALMVLDYMRYRACSPVSKLVVSAIANASNRLGLSKDDLWISEVRVDKGPILKRLRPRAQGRGYAIRKPSCSIILVVRETVTHDMASHLTLTDGVGLGKHDA